MKIVLVIFTPFPAFPHIGEGAQFKPFPLGETGKGVD